MSEASASTGGSGALQAEKPNEEVTIARPLNDPNPVTFSFRHRHMWSIFNKPTQNQLVQASTGFGPDCVFQANQFFILPVKAAAFWMTRGEQARLYNFHNIRFVTASMKLHNQSYRTQFVTGSTAIGYANSNMQIHGYIFQDSQNELPPYNIWPQTGGVTTNVVRGTDIRNLLYPSTSTTLGTQGPYATQEFVALTWEPWFISGYVPTNNAAAEIMADASWLNQVTIGMIQRSHILGKKVKEWNWSFNLGAAWGGRWVPLRSHTLPYYPSDIINGPQETDAMPSIGNAGCWGIAATPNGIAGGALNVMDDMMIVPDNPMEIIQPYSDPDEGVSNPNPLAAQRDFGTPGTMKHAGTLENVFLGVEHLSNQDGTTVPVVWDFYIDTEIVIEATYHTGLQFQAAAIETTFNTSAGNPKYRWNYIGVETAQSLNNLKHPRYGSYSASSLPARRPSRRTAGWGQDGILGYGHMTAAQFLP